MHDLKLAQAITTAPMMTVVERNGVSGKKDVILTVVTMAVMEVK